MKKIAVIAGTPIDTQMGVGLFEEFDVEVLSFAISSNPTEQTLFQTSSSAQKNAIIERVLDQIKKSACQQVLVYCNSLSGAVDFDTLAKDYQLNIVTPLHVYRELAMEYHHLAVLGANAQGLAGIEAVMFASNPQIKLLMLSLLPMVEMIERQESPQKIAEQFCFGELAQLLEGNQVEAVLLGCTHFPYVAHELAQRTYLPIINPAQTMLQKLSLQKK
ncbi:MAG: aspartate/glutamate racemase family protein [Aerococcaceae bacterium]|nr:aspartate/glutamate racemase family protein [Aerococcaceae bacterium]